MSALGCSAANPWSSKHTATRRFLATSVLTPTPLHSSLHDDNRSSLFAATDGQLSDLLALFREHGFPSNRSGGDIELASYVFNGDFVDRGPQQVEVAALLFSLKVCFPDRVFLLRGNHEFRAMNMDMSAGSGDGFDAACNQFFGSQVGPRVFESIHRRARTSAQKILKSRYSNSTSKCNTHVAPAHTPSAHLIGCLSLLSSKILCLFFTGESAWDYGR